MLFVTLGKAKATSLTKDRVARRAQWQYPAGIQVLGEYWLLTSDPSLVMIAEADNPATLMSSIAQWDDALDLTVVPAMTAEQGLELAKQMAAETPA